MTHFSADLFPFNIVVAAFPSADRTIEHIADLLESDLPQARLTAPMLAASLESTR
jgi:hypothetical protein